MIIPYSLPNHSLIATAETKTARAHFLFPHPYIGLPRKNAEWQRRERQLINNVLWLGLTSPVALVKAPAVDVNVVTYDCTVPQAELLTQDDTDPDGLAVITGDLNLPAGSHLLANAPARLFGRDPDSGAVIIPTDDQLLEYATLSSLRRAAHSIRTIYELPARTY